MKGPFKLKSGNTTPFKLMGGSPMKQASHGLIGDMPPSKGVVERAKANLKKYTKKHGGKFLKDRPWLKSELKKTIKKGEKFATKTGKIAKKTVKLGGRALGLFASLMLTPTSSSASDQPNYPKGHTHYTDPEKDIFKKK